DNLMTLETTLIRPLQPNKNEFAVQRLKIISFTHKTIGLSELNKFFIEEGKRNSWLSFLKESASIDELFYLATCNRIEFIFSTEQDCDETFLRFFFKKLNSEWNSFELDFAVKKAKVYSGD